MSHTADIVMRASTAGEQFFDVGGYHNLEHDFWACAAQGQHFSLWWTYFGREALEFNLIGRPWRATLCRLNIHLWTSFWNGPALGQRDGEICNWCEATR